MLSTWSRSTAPPPTSPWFCRICAMPDASPSVLIFVATKRRPLNSDAVSTRPNSSSISGVRGEVSTTRPPRSRSMRITAATGSVPSVGISSTGFEEPKPTMGSVSSVPGIGRVGSASWTGRGLPSSVRGAASAAPRPARRARKSRRVVSCGVGIRPPFDVLARPRRARARRRPAGPRGGPFSMPGGECRGKIQGSGTPAT